MPARKAKLSSKKTKALKTPKIKKAAAYHRHRAAAEGKREAVIGGELIIRPMTAGRPSLCKPEIYEPILKRLAAGASLISICAEVGQPDVTTVTGWCQRYPEFDKLYRQALALRTHVWGEQTLMIADTPVAFEKVTRVNSEKNGDSETVVTFDSPEHRKLQVDTRFKMMARHNRADYGEKIETDNKHEHNINIKTITRRVVRPPVIDHEP